MKIVAHTLFIFAGLFLFFNEAKAEIVDRGFSARYDWNAPVPKEEPYYTYSSWGGWQRNWGVTYYWPLLEPAACRNINMTKISEGQAFSPGDEIDFAFSVECQSLCSGGNLLGVNAGARLGNWSTVDVVISTPWDGRTEDRLDSKRDGTFLTGLNHSTMENKVTVQDIGSGWHRLSLSELKAEIPNNLPQSYNAAAIYPVFFCSNQSGYNHGSWGEKITMPCVPNCSCAANTCIGETCSDGCGGTCSGTKVCECTGSIPSGHEAWDSEESAGLTSAVPWQLSATDTSRKCEYKSSCTCAEDFYKITTDNKVYKPNDSQLLTTCIGEKGTAGHCQNCRKITNNCTLPIFVPAKTNPEWISLPIDRTNFADCITSVPCN